MGLVEHGVYPSNAILIGKNIPDWKFHKDRGLWQFPVPRFTLQIGNRTLKAYESCTATSASVREGPISLRATR